jgi:hypothetical protein
MEISRRWLTVVCALVLLALAALVIRVQHEQDTQKRKADTTRQSDANRNCRRASERTALAAAFIFAEGFDRAPRDSGLNSGYARGLLDTIPLLPQDRNSPAVADVERIENPNHVVTFQLTADALALQKAGCDAVFPPH